MNAVIEEHEKALFGERKQASHEATIDYQNIATVEEQLIVEIESLTGWFVCHKDSRYM